MKDKQTISLVDYIEILVKWRKLLIINVIIITFVAAVLSFLLPQKYTARATILPPSSQQDALLGMMSGNIPTGLSSLARMGGMSFGLASPSDLYAAIMQSGRIKGSIIKQYDLKKVFKCKTIDDTYKRLDGITKIVVQPVGIIHVSVTYEDKYLAVEIANAFVEELDKFNTETAMTVGKRYRIFIEERLEENEDSLAKTEGALRDFQEKHRTIALDVEIQSVIETIAELKSEIILLEVQKGTIGTSSSINNPYVENINQRLRELKKQLAKIEIGSKVEKKDEFGIGFSVPLSKLPELSLEYVRLFRDAKIQEAIFELLAQQYEQAKIMEVKDTPTVQFLDRAGVPEKRSFPVRRTVVLLGFIISIVTGILVAFSLEYIGNVKKGKTKLSHKWIVIVEELHGDSRKILKKLKKFRFFSKWTT